MRYAFLIWRNKTYLLNEDLFNLVTTYQVHYTQNHVGNIGILIIDITLESFSQIEQLQKLLCSIKCRMTKKYNSTKT